MELTGGTITIIILSVIVVLLLIGVRNLLKQNEQLEDMLNEYMTGMRNLAQRSLNTMRDLDANGAFESDDEVGAVFNDLKSIVEHLNERVGNTNAREGEGEAY